MSTSSTETPVAEVETPEEVQTQPDASEGGKDSREAAKYRTRLRETELELNYHREMVENMQKREVARIAGEKLAKASDLFEIGEVHLGDLSDDDGYVDADKVAKPLTCC